MKHYRHFEDAATVHALVEEIQGRHGCSYEQLAERLIVQLRDYFDGSHYAGGQPSRFQNVGSGQVRQRYLVALSGGIDSTVVTYLAVRAVGRESVLPITMPARPDDESVGLAALVRYDLGFSEPGAPYIIDIEPIVQQHMHAMSTLSEPQLHLGREHASQALEQKMRSGNFGSRVRVAVLSDLQRAIRGRILGTVNRTEYCQGYGTKFGTPISYDFGVLNELYKVDINELARVLAVPEAVRDALPSTGYFAGQTHEGELGASIEEQDIFAYLLFEKNMAPEEIAATYGASAEFARVIQYRFDVSEHKRLLNGLQPQVRLASTPLRL
ncbi:MAG: NAD(+) synthase [Ardenticatenales bacterium]|nr:NAD(+) synthase [Ardenticatenales bacterium]